MWPERLKRPNDQKFRKSTWAKMDQSPKKAKLTKFKIKPKRPKLP